MGIPYLSFYEKTQLLNLVIIWEYILFCLLICGIMVEGE